MNGTKDATLRTEGDRAVVRLERTLARAPQAVWRALTDAEELKAWFPCDVVAEAWEVGAKIRFPFPGGELVLTGTVLEVDEPRVLAYTWGEETLRFELSPAADGGTLLVMTDTLDRPIAARNAAGWQVCLSTLEGREPPQDAWKGWFERYAAAFEPSVGPQEGPPAGYEKHQR